MASPGRTSDRTDTGWGFARRPRWILSHLFVLALLGLFVTAGFWQLSRLSDRRVTNDLIEARASLEPQTVSVAVGAAVTAVASDPQLAGGRTPAELAAPTTDSADPVGLALDYTAVADEGRWLVDEIVRVANRSQNGQAGDWSIGVFETSDGALVLVNRGFIGRDAVTPPPTDGPVDGWLRRSRIRDGLFGADDAGGDRVPRLDVAAIASRLDPAEQDRLVPVWLQLAETETEAEAETDTEGEAQSEDGTVPLTAGLLAPVPLPPISEGNHLSYAVQWFTFTVMGAGAYGLVLRRRARRGSSDVELAPGPAANPPSV